MQPGIAKLHR